jgi:hypothetical protein
VWSLKIKELTKFIRRHGLVGCTTSRTLVVLVLVCIYSVRRAREAEKKKNKQADFMVSVCAHVSLAWLWFQMDLVGVLRHVPQDQLHSCQCLRVIDGARVQLVGQLIQIRQSLDFRG